TCPRARAFFFSSRRRHTRFDCDWNSDVCSSDLGGSPRSLGCRHTWSTPRTVGRASVYAGGTFFYGFNEPVLALALSESHIESMRSEERRVGKECMCELVGV